AGIVLRDGPAEFLHFGGNLVGGEQDFADVGVEGAVGLGRQGSGHRPLSCASVPRIGAASSSSPNLSIRSRKSLRLNSLMLMSGYSSCKRWILRFLMRISFGRRVVSSMYRSWPGR